MRHEEEYNGRILDRALVSTFFLLGVDYVWPSRSSTAPAWQCDHFLEDQAGVQVSEPGAHEEL